MWKLENTNSVLQEEKTYSIGKYDFCDFNISKQFIQFFLYGPICFIYEKESLKLFLGQFSYENFTIYKENYSNFFFHNIMREEEVSEIFRQDLFRKILLYIQLKNKSSKIFNRFQSINDHMILMQEIITDIQLSYFQSFDFSNQRQRWFFLCYIWCLYNHIYRWSVITHAINNPHITEIMVNRFDKIYLEKKGKVYLSKIKFANQVEFMTTLQRIVNDQGRHIDEAHPYCDVKLQDGSRVHAILCPLSLTSPHLTIRKFSKTKIHYGQLIEYGSADKNIINFLKNIIKYKKNVLIIGGTSSGKTTLLNVMGDFINPRERIITIEDTAELNISKPHVIRLEARAGNTENRGVVTIRDLLKNTLRMRPDRIIIGECRGDETLDMLQALNTGHNGSMTTLHANSSKEALLRMETLCLMAQSNLCQQAVRPQISTAIHYIVKQSRLANGERKIMCIDKVLKQSSQGYRIQKIMAYDIKNNIWKWFL